MDWSNIGIRLLVRDFHGSFDFFTKRIGLEVEWGNRDSDYVAFTVPDGAKPCLAIFKADLQTGFQGYTPPEGSGLTDKVTLSIPSDDVDADYAALKAKGVVFIGEPQTIRAWYMRCVYFRDPEGNLFELCNAIDFDSE